jgi:hypothetical protein
MRQAVFAAMIAALLAGCAGPLATVRPGPSVPASMAAEADAAAAPPVTAFDGTYRGTIRTVSAFGSAQTTAWCTSPGQPVITVTEGQFTYAVPHPNVPGNATPVYPATIAADGSVYGQIVAGTLSGQVDGTQMSGRIDGSACIYAFVANRM